MTAPHAKGFIVLEDPKDPNGIAFEGTLFGRIQSAAQITDRAGYGEAVFNTSLTGYQEILTDPSYFGQIIVMTTPHIGNTGINSLDHESKRVWCGGFVVHALTQTPSNWQSEQTLDAYLQQQGIPAIQGVDTRAITLHLRTRGVVRALILTENDRHLAAQLFAKLPLFEGRDLIREVSVKEAYPFTSSQSKNTSKKLKVVALDFGVKTNLLRSLEALGCDVEVLPCDTSAATILSKKPHGVFLSNGPGDPAAAPYAAKTVNQLVGKIPLFGVCMGHQILALSQGAKTYKLKFGHRGGNQPVLDHTTGQIEISSHNHGYSVDDSSLGDRLEVTHINLNDKTVEGIRVKAKKGEAPAFSVQYHPEACPGPHDSVHLFDRFIGEMNEFWAAHE